MTRSIPSARGTAGTLSDPPLALLALTVRRSARSPRAPAHMTDRAPRAARSWQRSEEEDIWLGPPRPGGAGGRPGARDALWSAVGPRLVRMRRAHAWAFPSLERDDAVQESFPIFAALVADMAGPTGGWRRVRDLSVWHVSLATPFDPACLRAPASATFADVGARGTAGRRAIRSAPIAWQEYGVDLPAFVVLPDHERVIFLLRVREGLATREVADRISLTPHRLPLLQSHPPPPARAYAAGNGEVSG